jgi:hypothetical protein
MRPSAVSTRWRKVCHVYRPRRITYVKQIGKVVRHVIDEYMTMCTTILYDNIRRFVRRLMRRLYMTVVLSLADIEVRIDGMRCLDKL